MLNITLAVLVWMNFLDLKIAKKLSKNLQDKVAPSTIEEVLKALEEAEKEI